MMLVLIVYTFTRVGLHRRHGHARDAAQRAHRHRGRGRLAAVAAHRGGLLPAAVHAAAPDHAAEVDAGMDAGRYTFVLTFRPTSSATCWPGARPRVQLNVDATRMSQAFTGSGYIQQIVAGEVAEFVQRYRGSRAAAGGPGLRACASTRR
jgi:ABC-2 type transport system permease protein